MIKYLPQESTSNDIAPLNEGVSKVVDFKTMLVNIIPSNIVDAMAKSDLLAVIFFAILFGVAAGAIGKASEALFTRKNHWSFAYGRYRDT